MQGAKRAKILSLAKSTPGAGIIIGSKVQPVVYVWIVCGICPSKLIAWQASLHFDCRYLTVGLLIS